MSSADDTDVAFRAAAAAAELAWALDPIDGTGCFIRREPHWRIQLALQVRGTTEVALVIAPALACCWWAVRRGSTRPG